MERNHADFSLEETPNQAASGHSTPHKATREAGTSCADSKQPRHKVRQGIDRQKLPSLKNLAFKEPMTTSVVEAILMTTTTQTCDPPVVEKPCPEPTYPGVLASDRST